MAKYVGMINMKKIIDSEQLALNYKTLLKIDGSKKFIDLIDYLIKATNCLETIVGGITYDEKDFKKRELLLRREYAYLKFYMYVNWLIMINFKLPSFIKEVDE